MIGLYMNPSTISAIGKNRWLKSPMIPKHKTGRIIVWTLALMPLALWILAGLPGLHFDRPRSILKNIGFITGLIGMAALSISFVLASRAKFLEDYFGGLDKMYRVHHQLGVAAFCLLLVHPVVLALRFIPERAEKALLFLFPFHGKLSVNFGSYAFWIFVLLMLLTLFIKIPYDKWKISHKFLGLVLILGAVHMLTGRGTVSQYPVMRFYMLSLTALGVVSFAYKAFILPFLSRKNMYVVNAVRRLNEEVIEIELAPGQNQVNFAPSQYVFVSFYQDELTQESHPFTICTAPEERNFKLTVKASGDFTTTLYNRLEKGTPVSVEGPYGRFDYRKGSQNQVWIAGGVGIAPFLGWARNMKHKRDRKHSVDFYYCVHSRGDAVHYRELAEIGKELENLHVNLVCSEERGHIHAREIKYLGDKDIFMCGPKRLTSDLRNQFQQLGIPEERIHFEDFEFD